MSDEGIIAGSAVAVGLTIFMCTCGIPMIFAGAIMIYIYDVAEEDDKDSLETIFIIGIVLVSVSGLLLVAGAVLSILLCTVCNKKKNRTAPAPQATVLVTQEQTYPVTTHQAYPPPPAAGSGHPGYSIAPPPPPGQTYGGANPGMAPEPALPPAPPPYDSTNYNTKYN